MAGVLPGVEAARIRKIHQAKLSKTGSTRRSSFCLYSSNRLEFQIGSTPSKEKNPVNQAAYDDKSLEAAAREAKGRLDRRLQSLWNGSKGKQKK